MKFSTLKWTKITAVLLLLISLFPTFPSEGRAQQSAPDWKRVSFGTRLHSAAWSGSSYVAVGDRGTIYQSADGVSWTFRESPTQDRMLTDVEWGNDTFVAVGVQGEIMTSPDGVDWTVRRNIDGRTTISSVKWINNQFIAAGYYRHNDMALGTKGMILVSADGMDWTVKTDSALDTFNAVAWGKDKYVAAGNGGVLYTSPDLENWTIQDSKSTDTHHFDDVAWGNDLFVAAGSGGQIRTSTDGVTWTVHDYTANNREWFHDVLWVNNRFLAFGFNTVLASTDGQNWTPYSYGITGLESGGINGGAWGNNEFIAVGDESIIVTSADAEVWSKQRTAAATGQNLNAVAWGGSGFVAVGEEGAVVSSADGDVWAKQSSGVTNLLTDIAWGNGIYVAVGEDSRILTSPDGSSWTPRTSAADNTRFKTIGWGNGLFVAGGSGSTLQTSSDGVTWTAISVPATYIVSVSWIDNQFMVSALDGNKYKLLTSSDGITWTARETDFLVSHIVKGNGKFMALVESAPGTIATSDDGITWTTSVLADRLFPRELYFAGNQFTVVGNWSYIYTSTDGENWTPRNSRADIWQVSLSDVTWGNDRLVAVGSWMLVLTAPLALAPSEDGTVTGKVVDAAQSPISGATVTAGGISATTNAEGTFTLSSVKAGTQTLEASAEGYQPGTKSITVTAGQQTDAGLIQLTAAGQESNGNNEDNASPAPSATADSVPSAPAALPAATPAPVPTASAAPSVSPSATPVPAASEPADSGELAQDPNDIFRSQVVKADNNVIAGVQARTAEILKAGSDLSTIDYSDIGQHWAIGSIEKLTKLGVINGYPTGGFEPDNTITRAEFAAMIARGFVDMAGRTVNIQPEDYTAFRDINNHWSSKYLMKLVRVGVMTGYGDGTIRPEQTISRQEMAVMITRVLNPSVLNKDTSKVTFTDLNGSYAQDAVKKAAALGIFEGKTAQSFDPLGGATRAESIETIIKTYQLSPALKEALSRLN
ncbi:S-layer homology domain-containing protein [Paenibacillus glufosinatiresistens]|uniref:S-layer homology domain-containing protein n=1 Tax=Paenibacillus glufosinatiresistens TaxID=3070657 RepID=UPI00286E4427|nr:S-layer homology domain-containing protein [Paenibacillus sp. YX.27]